MKKLTFALSLLISSAAIAPANEIQTAIDDGIAAYKGEQYSQAASQFELAAQLLREMSGASIAKALPAAPEGWAPDGEADVQAVGASIMGGMTSAAQSYSKGDSHISVRIMSDSPMIGQIGMLINNPAMVRQMGQKVIKVKDAQGILSFEDGSSSGSISAIALHRYFISVEGDGVSASDLQNFLGLVDFEVLKEQ